MWVGEILADAIPGRAVPVTGCPLLIGTVPTYVQGRCKLSILTA